MIAAILAQALYLARRPLLERTILDGLEQALSDELGGRVELGGLAGNWLTSIELTGLQLRGGSGALAAVENGRVRARLALWRGLGGDPLLVLRRLEVDADRVELDLEAEAGAPASEGSDFSLESAHRLVPGGAVIRCADLVLQGGGLRRSGRSGARLEPRRGARPRVLALDVPGASARGELTPDEVRAELAVDAAGDLVALLGGGDAIVGGRVHATAVARLEPELRVQLQAGIEDSTAFGHRIASLDASAEIEGDALLVRDLQLRADGARIDLRSVACELAAPADFLSSVRGTALVDVPDVAPFADVLPAEVVALAPAISGEVFLRQGRWDVAQLRLRTPDGDRVTADGSFDPSALGSIDALASLGSVDLAERITLGVVAERLRAGPLARALALDEVAGDVAGELRGSATWNAAESLAVELLGDLRRGDLSASVALSLQGDDSGARVDQLELRGAGAELLGTAASPSLTPRGLLERPEQLVEHELTAVATLTVPDLAELDLSKLGAPALAGSITAALSAGGTLGAPRPRAVVELAQVSMRAEGAPAVGELSGRVLVTPSRLELEDVRGVVEGRPLRAAGAIALGASEIAVEQLTLSEESAGSAELRGRIGTADVAELGDALLSRCELSATLADLDPGPWLALAGHPGIRGSLGGTVSWRADGAPRCEVALRGNATGRLGGDELERVELELDLQSDEDGSRLRSLEVRGAGAELRASLSAPSLTPRRILEGDAIGEQEIAAEAMLAVTDLAHLQLQRLGAPELSGLVRAELEVAGSFRAPRVRGVVTADGVGLSGAGAPRVEQLSGRLVLEPTRVELVDAHATVEGRPLDLAGAVARSDDALVIERLALSEPPGGAVEVSGRIGTAEPAQLVEALLDRCELHAKLTQLDVGPWLALAGRPDLGGSLAGALSWKADGAPSFEGHLAGTVTGPFPEPGREIEIELEVRGDRDGLAVRDLTASSGSSSLAGSATLTDVTPLDLLRRPERVWTAPLAAEAELEDLALSEVQAKALGLDDLGGDVAGHLTVGGTLAEPVPTLDLKLSKGYARLRSGQRFADVNGRIVVTEQRVGFDKVQASLGAGPVEIDGAFEAPDGLRAGWRTGRLDLRLHGADVLLYRRDGIKLRGDVELNAKGPPDAIQVTGSVLLHDSKVVSRVPYFDYSRVGGVAVRQGLGLEGFELGAGVHVRLDIEVSTAEPIDVKTNVVRGQVSVALRLTGPLAAPVLDGVLSGADSVLILPGCRFRAATLLVTFERDAPRFPTLNIVATGRRHGYDLTMSVRGRYDRPEVLFTSNPPLPAEDLVVLVTTGARPSTLKEQGARGVATTVGVHLADELAYYLFGSEATEEQESFIERFTIESGTEVSPEGTESVVVEFRVYDRFYLQGERDVHEFINFGLLYRIRFK